WNTIRTCGFNRARQVHRRNRLHRAVGAAVPKSPDLPRHQRSISSHPRLDDNDRCMARIPGHELFAIGHNHAYRTAGSLRQAVTEGEVHERSLTSKVTAYRADVNDNFFRGDTDRIRKTLLGLIRRLVTYPDMDNSRFFIDRKDARMRLQVGLMHMLGR